MTYELAQQLKDAGFPQHHGDIDYCKVFGCWLKDGIGRKADAHLPTLSELIEACLPHFRELEVLNNAELWQALGFRDAEQDKAFLARGKTPEEAVTRLYLALNEKK